ncbi:MAG: cytidylate kinase, partial [Phycisphaerales bacterium]|nr:cytidylate kinase [Phycisphaerales bacterium]
PPAVREVLVALQRDMGQQLGDFVTEGRDQGTVVFPNAEVKFFVTASGEERARRRVEQLAEQGEIADFETVLANILDRDESDYSRAVGPLKQPEDAIVINTDPNTPQQTIEQMLAHIQGSR